MQDISSSHHSISRRRSAGTIILSIVMMNGLQELSVILEEGVCVTVVSDIIANEASIETRKETR